MRFKDSNDPFTIVIVRDMWLTGFDAPCLHTMYADKPMRGHGLMQAIARVNRVFKDKPGGLIVDYLGLADQLKEALATYTSSGGRGSTNETTDAAVEVLVEKCEVANTMLHGFDWSASSTPLAGDRAIASAVTIRDDQESVVVEGMRDDVLVHVVAQIAVEPGADVLVDCL